ncbi:MAG TPA: response regulator [Roseiflexaceae bacterium]|nr:response regulator [Roseiflexaceae bacterium]
MARMLVIEDNPANLELMAYLLQAFGHTALVARDGEEGLAMARSELPDLIVCDVQMPRMDGYAIARQLKDAAETSAIPIIAVTALAMVGDSDRIMAHGFDGYIAKPIVPETFVAQVENFLDPAKYAASTPPVVAGDTAEAAQAPARDRARILVVDDSPVNRELMRSMLEPMGYAVVAAAGVREALELARERLPDLIVSDLHMPDQSGFDLIRAFKADPQLRDIKIMIHSATVMSENDRDEALNLGAQLFLMRPLDPQFVLAAIEACLDAQPELKHGDNSRS